jgi:hypothetical protein
MFKKKLGMTKQIMHKNCHVYQKKLGIMKQNVHRIFQNTGWQITSSKALSKHTEKSH